MFRTAIISLVLSAAACERFLSFSKAEICNAEPNLEMCRHQHYRNVLNRARASKLSTGEGLTAERLEHLRKHSTRGTVTEDIESTSNDDDEDPFEEIATRAPPSELRETRRRKNIYGSNMAYQRGNSMTYRVYPGLHPKDASYCPDMRAMFAYTCQPSKPLRLDLVEFCKDYAVFCGLPNFHRLPGPRMGYSPGDTSRGHVGVSGKFGFGVGAVPGLEVGAGWGVDVGPFPGMGESVGVDLGLDLGIMGSKSPEAFRRGQDNPNQAGGGIVGLSGGVGVKAPGTGPIGVGSGIGVGK